MAFCARSGGFSGTRRAFASSNLLRMVQLLVAAAILAAMYGLAILGLSRLAGLNHRAETRCTGPADESAEERCYAPLVARSGSK